MTVRNNEERLGVKDTGTNPPIPQPASSEASVPNTPLQFSTPTEFVDLPSGGKYYPSGHPLHGKDSAEIRFMTAKEEDILTSKTLLKKGIAIDRMLQNLVVDKTILIDELLIGDKNALIVAARISGYGADYETSVTCPACGTSCKHSFDLSDGAVHSGEENLEDIGMGVTKTPDNTFTTRLIKTDVEVELRLLTGKDEKALMKTAEKRKKHKLPENNSTEQTKMILVSVGGHTDVATINSLVDNLPALDSRQLREAYQKITPNIDLTQEFVCGTCDYEQDMEVPFTTDFFWPK